MRKISLGTWSLGVAAIAACGAAGCSSGLPNAPPAEEMTGIARATLQLTPANVRCVAIQVSNGTASVTRSFDVTPGSGDVFDLSGLPLGTDTFVATASTAACTDAGASPAVFSSGPVTASVSSGSAPTLTLVMMPVTDGGGASVGVTFPQATSGVITEFQGPVTTFGIALGPDGDLWTIGTNQIEKVTTSGAFTAFPFPTGTPQNGTSAYMAAGPDGNLWFSLLGGQTASPPQPGLLGRVSPEGTFVFLSPPAVTTALPQYAGITVGPDGSMWVIDYGQGLIVRFSAAGQTLGQFSAPNVKGVITNLVVGSDGNLWFAEGTKIGRLSTAGNLTEFPVPAFVSQLAAGSDGNLWATESPLTSGPSGILRMSTTGGSIATFPLPSTGSPFDIAPGPDGNLWFTETSKPGTAIGRIRLDGTITEFPTNDFPRGIVGGLDGNMWFSEFPGKVCRITT